jgi:hypothetical protein
MEQNHIIIIEQNQPELFASPHIADKLLLFILGDWFPDAHEQKQLIGHLLQCHDCRPVIKVLLAIEPENKKMRKDPKMPASGFLSRFISIIDAIEAKEYEQMSTFAEAFKKEGQTKAEKCFPALAIHLKSCLLCKEALDDILVYLYA